MTNFNKAAYLGQWYEYSNVFEFYEDLPCKDNVYNFQPHFIYNMTSFIAKAFLCQLSNMLPIDKDGLTNNADIWSKHCFQVGGKCVRATYTDEGDQVGVLNEFVSEV